MSHKKQYIQLTSLCTIVYFTSYISRINLSAVMVELIQSGFAQKSVVALALTMCSITYALGQIISGWMGDRFKPQNIITAGLLLTAAMNLAISGLKYPELLVVLWTVNGFAQACMWPPLLQILVTHLTWDEYNNACVWVTWGSSFGTITVYAVAPFLIHFGSFRMVFFCSGATAMAVAVIWTILYKKNFCVPPLQRSVQIHEETTIATRLSCSMCALIACIMVAIVLQGALRDGVTNWMPTFVCESFKIDASSAIFSGVLLSLFSIVCTKIASSLYRKYLSNELVAAGVFFVLGTVSALLLNRFIGTSVWLSALLMAVLVGCMYGVNFILLSITPLHFRRLGHVSLISGILNSSTYLGSALSTYGFALISETLGWKETSLIWAGIAGTGATLCFALAKPWLHFKTK